MAYNANLRVDKLENPLFPLVASDYVHLNYLPLYAVDIAQRIVLMPVDYAVLLDAVFHVSH